MNNNETLQEDKKKPSHRKYILAAGLILILIIAALAFSALKWESKPNPASEKIIREAAGKQLNKSPNSLTDEDFAQITNISIINKELSDIRLLEKFTNLQVLLLVSIHYPSNKIPKWMKTLAKLGIYDIKERAVMDLEPLAGLTNLKNLNLGFTGISDIEPLANLIYLNELNLGNTQVSDIKSLANLKSLKTLYLNNTKISDISMLVNLTNLQNLNLSNMNVSDEQIKKLQKALPNLRITR